MGAMVEAGALGAGLAIRPQAQARAGALTHGQWWSIFTMHLRM